MGKRPLWAIVGVCIVAVIVLAVLLGTGHGARGGGGGGTSGVTIPYKNPGIFVEDTIGTIDSLDPAWAYDTASGEQLTYIYETLIAFNGTSTNTYVPVLADSYSVNGKQITFHIHSGVTFQNGDPLTAADVKYSIERAMVMDRDGGPIWMLYSPLLNLGGSRDTNGNIQVTFSQIDNAVQVSGDNVIFNLYSASWAPQFLQILTGTWASIVDKSWCVANGEWDGTAANWTAYNNGAKQDSYLFNHANGTGPWKLAQTSDWNQGISITLTKNDSWWQGTPPFNNVITKYVDEWSTRKSDLENGLADEIYVPRQYIHQLDADTSLQVYKDLPQLQCDSFFFNFNITLPSSYIGSGKLDGNGIPPDFFSDINVRKGFCEVFDYQTYISDALLGEAKQLGSPVVEGLPYYNLNTPKYSYDLAAANASFNAAWGGQLATTGFKFTLTYNSGNDVRKTACEILAQDLLQINPKFQVSIQPVVWNTFLDDIVSGVLPMFQVGWLADYPDPDDFVVPFMASWGTYSEWQHYSNPTVDSLIKQGEQTTDPTTRQNIYYQLQQLYYTDAPGIMLAQPTGRRYFTPYIHGYYFNPMIPGDPGPVWAMSKSSS